MPQSVSYLWQRTLRQSASAEEPPFVRIDPTPRLREHTDLPRRTLRFAASMLAKTPRIPVPLFIPPIIAGHNTTQITDDMYLIKTGMRKQGDKLQFWTLQNHSYTPDSKSAKVQFSMDCLAKIYSPIALATYPELDGKGKQIKSTTFDPKFRPIREKSAMDRLHSLLCPKPAPQQP